MTAQDGLAAEEAEESKNSFIPTYLKGKIQIMHRNIVLTAQPL
jgi:hypothetical protein